MDCSEVIWIDHHKTAIPEHLMEEQGMEGIRGIGTAACELTWEYLYGPDDYCYELIQYLSAYDVWNKERFDWNDVMAIQYAARARVGLNVDNMVHLIEASGSQGTILVDSKYVYPLFGEECSDEEFKVIMETMKDIHNKKDEMMKDNNQESIKNDIQDDKLRWDLLPLEEIEDIVRVYHAGAKKYGPNRWQNLEDGFQRYKAAALRHLMEYEKGERVDADTGCLHLAQFAWNAIAMLYLDKHGKGLIKNNEK